MIITDNVSQLVARKPKYLWEVFFFFVYLLFVFYVVLKYKYS